MTKSASQGTTTRAGLAGAGGGTGLVAVAQSLSPSNALKPVLLYLAPSASVILGTLGYFVQVEAGRLWRRRMIRRGREAVQEFLDNPKISEHRKATVRDQWEKAEQSLTLEELNRMSFHASVPPAREDL